MKVQTNIFDLQMQVFIYVFIIVQNGCNNLSPSNLF